MIDGWHRRAVAIEAPVVPPLAHARIRVNCSTHRFSLANKLMRCLLLCFAATVMAAAPSRALEVAKDSTFRTGSCTPGVIPKVNWDSVVTNPETPVRPTRESVLRFPTSLQAENGAYSGMATAAMLVGADGSVIPGTVSIEESTDPRLSASVCEAVPRLRFEPARVKGVPVAATFQQPYRYLRPPTRKAP